HALLADFGIARAFCEEDDEDLDTVTAAGITLGTPEYMSPEQASGERTLGVRSDVYSLACVFFEMLTGEPPHRGASARSTMAKHVTETPRRVRALRSEVPVSIDEAIARALAPDPEFRFATVADFCAALETDGAPRGYIAATMTRSIA